MSAEIPRPEAVLASTVAYDGKVLRVRVDEVRFADGRSAVREVVEYPNSVVVVPIDADDNVVLVRQYRHPAGSALLEAPAGKRDGAEEPEEAAQRELREEIGHRAGRLRSLGSFWTTPGFCTELIHAFVATDLSPSRLEQDTDEDIVTETAPLSAVTDLIRTGVIQDGKTIAALLLAMHVYNEESQEDGRT